MSRLILSTAMIGVLAVTTGSAETPVPEPAKLTGTIQEMLNTETQFAGVDDPKATFIEVLQQLRARYGFAFQLNDNAFESENTPNFRNIPVADPYPIEKMNAPLAAVLKVILAKVKVPYGAAYIVRDDYIEFTTARAISREFYGGRLPIGGLPPLVKLQFEKESLPNALKKLARQAGKNILLDPRCAEEEELDMHMDLANVPLDTAVLLLADMAGLAMVPMDNVYYVTTPENAARLRKERPALVAPPPEVKPSPKPEPKG